MAITATPPGPTQDVRPVRRALVSVFDKTGLEGLVRGLHDAGVELVSTGGSAALIDALGLPVTKVEELTGFPECLEGRVKTLHPMVHAGLLADTRKDDHLAQLDELGVADPLGVGLGRLMRIFHRGNALRHERLADPRFTDLDVTALLKYGLADVTAVGAAGTGHAPVARGDTVGIAAADDRGYAVSLIQSVYHAFGSGLIDPETGILFHNRGTSFSLDAASPNVR